MELGSSFHVRRRAAALWVVITTAVTGLVGLVARPASELLRAPGTTFADLLVQVCAVAALLAGATVWLATTDVALDVLRGSGAGTGRRRIGPLRSALLAACGIAVLTTTAPAGATPPDGPEQPTTSELLEGLPLPDRAVGASAPPALAHHPAEGRGVSTTVRVRPGDSLWSIAARASAPDASEAEVAAYWRRLGALNAAALGSAPDLIHPGQRLDLPPR